MSRRWLHPNVNAVDAQRILLGYGIEEGSCLLRRSFSKIGQFVISIRVGNKVFHLNIYKDGNLFYLNYTDRFDTLTDLIVHYMTHKLKNDTVIQLSLFKPIESFELSNERWYHGLISNKESTFAILQKGHSGSYLVRVSQSKPGNYVLTINVNDTVVEFKIIFNGEKYDIGGGRKFSSISDLIKFYSSNPIVDQNGLVIHLMNPVNVTQISLPEIVICVNKHKFQKYQFYLGTGGFWEEFDVLQQWETKRVLKKDIGLLDENKSKNRYSNILPYDHSRIVLKNYDMNVPGSDYINANMIKLKPSSLGKNYETRNYIVTQSCLHNTINEFWKMIWQKDSRIIVMITKLFENSKEKCVQYWPNVGQSYVCGKIFITNTREYTHQPDIIIRIFNVSFANYSHRTIFQLHYVGWPDFGVPLDAGSFLDLLFVVNAHQFDIESQSKVSHPLTVHCSAGIGRTGTFVVLDLLIGLINRKGLDCELDIQRTTHMVRAFRSGLVQSEAQYQFIYTAINHYIQTISSRISAEIKTKILGQEYMNINFTNELERIVGKENVPTLNIHTAQKILQNAITYNTNLTTDSLLMFPTLNKTKVEHGKLNTQMLTVTTTYLSPNLPTSNRFDLHSYENVTPVSIPSSKNNGAPPSTEATPPHPKSPSIGL